MLSPVYKELRRISSFVLAKHQEEILTNNGPKPRLKIILVQNLEYLGVGISQYKFSNNIWVNIIENFTIIIGLII